MFPLILRTLEDSVELIEARRAAPVIPCWELGDKMRWKDVGHAAQGTFRQPLNEVAK